MKEFKNMISYEGIGSRCIRVFLSSTFQDMQKERDFLVNHTFPAVQHIAAQRHVDFSVVDLRWGVTEEEAHQGKVIEICLNEIKNTHPFFIGIVGDRYGWCPNRQDISKNPKLLNLFPEVECYVDQGLSMTEIEMQYGALSDMDNVFAKFFIKKSENNLSEESHLEQQKLENLRAIIAKKAKEGRCGMQLYDTPEKLGECVLKSLTTLLDELYPASTTDEVSMLIERQHYLVSQMQAVYENDDLFDVMRRGISELLVDYHADRFCISVTNREDCVGKTALASNWTMSDNAYHIIRTILNKEDCTAEIAIQHLLSELSLLNMTPSKNIIWTIDGLDYLMSDEDRSLQWLMRDEVRKVQLVLTANDPTILKSIEAVCDADGRLGSTIYIGTVQESDIKKITILYLKQYAKALSEKQLQRITSQTIFRKNILLLKLFLNALVQFGIYEELDEFMHPYISASTEEELIETILSRLEIEYGEDIISIYMGFLALTEYGIPETMLRQLTKLNVIKWAALRNATSIFLDNNHSLMVINNRLRTYINNRYNSKEEELKRRNILKKLYLSMLNEPQSNQRSHIALCVEYIRQQLATEGPEETFKRESWHIWGKAKGYDSNLTYAFDQYINKSAQRLHDCLPDEMLCDIGNYSVTALVDYVYGTLFGNIEELKIFDRLIKERNLSPKFMAEWNKILSDFIMRKTAKTDQLEDTWIDTPIRQINLYEYYEFESELIMITQKERIMHIDQVLSNLIHRYWQLEEEDKVDCTNVIARLLYLKSYCCLRMKDYNLMSQFRNMSAQMDPQNYNNLSMTSFQISLALNLNIECDDIINQLIERANKEQNPDGIGVAYTMELLYAAHNGRSKEVLEWSNKIMSFWLPDNYLPGNLSRACYLTYWAATMLETNEFYEYAYDMHKKAEEISIQAGHEKLKQMCHDAVLRCQQYVEK